VNLGRFTWQHPAVEEHEPFLGASSHVDEQPMVNCECCADDTGFHISASYELIIYMFI
jgi:hypothetical protein